MKALVCTQLGDPSVPDLKVLRVADVQPPTLPPNSVRIRVTAGSLNFADALQVQGQYQEKPKLPFIPGNECSGVVTEVGRDVRGLHKGDSVCAVTQCGAFAEEVVAPAVATIKIPATCDVEAAAGLPVAFGTSWMALRNRADVKAGQTVLILGAAGGVGLAAVQLAKIFGASVVAVAQGGAKMDALKAAGADKCINMHGRRPEDIRSLVKRAAPQGIDVLIDPVGGTAAMEAYKCLNWGGQVVVIGFASGKVPVFAANLALVKNVSIHGVYWGSHMEHHPKAFRRSLEEVAKLFANGEIQVHISHKYSLEQASEAFSVIMNRGVVGKILLLPAPRSML